jgi:hypothetical protein
VINPEALFNGNPPATPPPPPNVAPTIVQDRNYATQYPQIIASNATTYLYESADPAGSNFLTEAVFVINNKNSGFQVNIYNPGADPANPDFSTELIAEFAPTTAGPSGTFFNNLYFEDFFSSDPVSFLVAVGLAGGQRTTFEPFCYWPGPFQSTPLGIFLGPPAQPVTIPPGTFAVGQTNAFITNQYAAWQALLEPVSQIFAETGGEGPTNAPGRIEITADSYLKMDNARITALNYVLLKATNQFGGSPGAIIDAPFYDVYLRSTNGLLDMTNVVVPTITRPQGGVDLYSARWTNFLAGITNRYHVWFIDATGAQVSSPPIIDNLWLQSTNLITPGGTDSIFIHDVINVAQTLLLDTTRLTISTNADGSLGGLDVLIPQVVWSTSAPRLEFFTNYGFFMATNFVFFGGTQSSPLSPPSVQPYQAFVNAGYMTNFGVQIQADYFEDRGTNVAQAGTITVLSQAALMTNGAMLALSNSISLTSGSMVISNYVLNAGGALFLDSPNLDDGSLCANSADNITNQNSWVVNNGVNLLAPPNLASLLATTISSTALPFRNVINRWAGADRGNDSSGFYNNAALGRLILDGGTNSVFSFSPVAGNNAIYIDLLQLKGSITRIDASGNFAGLKVNSGMKVYYGQAIDAAGVSVAEKLATATPGMFWVTNYRCGTFSSTNLVYDGQTNRLNAALVTSTKLDSDNDGIPNASDPSPVEPGPGIGGCAPGQCLSFGLAVAAPANADSNPSPAVASGPLKLFVPAEAAAPSSASNSFTAMKASYAGLFSDATNAATPGNSGYFSASTTERGSFSARILLAGHSYPFTGVLNKSGRAAAKVLRGNSAAALSVNLQMSGDQLSGTLSDGHWVANLAANRLSFIRANPTPLAGLYTMAIDVTRTNKSAGSGFGTVKVDAAGGVLWNGTLADGTKVSQKSALSGQGLWPLYASLYGGRGVAMSWMKVTNGGLDGQLIWLKSPGTPLKYYPSGFTNGLTAAGLSYAKPERGQSVVSWAGDKGELSLEGGGLASAINIPIELSANNRFTSPSQKLVFSINPLTGLFKGSISASGAGKPLQFQGVLLQGENTGYGFFLGSNRSGPVVLAPGN